MKHLFVSYEIAKILKEKGFNEPCFGLFSEMEGDNNKFLWATTSLDHVIEMAKKGHNFFDNSPGDKTRIQHFYSNSEGNAAAAPLYQQVIDWLRTEKGIDIALDLSIPQYYNFKISKYGTILEGDFSNEHYYPALNKAIETALNLIK